MERRGSAQVSTTDDEASAEMERRGSAQVSTADDEGEETRSRDARRNENRTEEERESSSAAEESGSGGEEQDDACEDEEGEQQDDDGAPKPVGDVIKVTGNGRNKKEYYAAFEFVGNQYELEDSVLMAPKNKEEKPSIAILKEITRDSGGSMMVTRQWFYRPDEETTKHSSNWQTIDTRELFYSFYLDEVPAESVMHKCVVHFIPPHKQLPSRTEHPGFIVRKICDYSEKRVWKITDKDYDDDRQQQINMLIKKTRERLGELPDNVDALENKWNPRKRSKLLSDASRDDSTIIRSSLQSKEKDASEFCLVLKEFRVSTGDTKRDKWLEKLLQGIHSICNMKDSTSVADTEKNSGSASKVSDVVSTVCESEEVSSIADEDVVWPDNAVPAVVALEKAVHEAFCSDFQKYNQKMRQLQFNLKNSAPLAKRLLKKELEPSVIVKMSPCELKDGFTADEKKAQEPEQPRHMQMTDARCSRCTEKTVGVVDIINRGRDGDRYQLECSACGHTWYASGDAISSLTLGEVGGAASVGTAPLATAKFEVVEKKLINPRDREPDKPVADDVFLKATAAYMPVLDSSKSFKRA